jgi:DNA polymerase III subunit epsilon
MPSINRHPQSHKLALTNALPRSPGVYVFKDGTGTVIYVGKATNLRARVRSYFGGDDRRKIGPMLEILHRIEHLPCETPIEAAILEVRLIQRYLPRFNRQAKLWTNYAYLRIIGSGRAPKVATTRDVSGVEGARYVGPSPPHESPASPFVSSSHTTVTRGPGSSTTIPRRSSHPSKR